MIIAFSGTDGAGKSTQIDALSQAIEGAGYKTAYIWARGGYTPLLRAVKAPVLRVLGRNPNAETAAAQKFGGYSNRRANLMRRPIISRIWLVVAIIDLALLYGVYVRYLSLRGRIVICDRYTGDTRIDFARNFPDTYNERGLLWRLLTTVAPRPDLHILLTVPVDVSVARSLAKKEPFPDDVSTLRFRLERYQSLPEFSADRVLPLGGTAPIDEIAAEIRNAVRSAKPGLLPE